MKKKLGFEAKEKIVELSGACFWFWASFYSFLDSCEVSKSLQKKYPREAYNKYSMMRGILTELDTTGGLETINSIASGFYKLKGAIDRDHLDDVKAKRLLQEFRELIGDDPIDTEIQKRKRDEHRLLHQKTIDERQRNTINMQKINSQFFSLLNDSGITPQQRGYQLETIFFELLRLSEIEHNKPYKHQQEQIDGHFRYDKFDYLVEVKWTEGLTKQPDLSVFDGKIRGKAQSTRGFFISANGFDESAVHKYSGDSPRIILMTGEDMTLVLSGQIDFCDLIRAKIDAIVRLGVILYRARDIRT